MDRNFPGPCSACCTCPAPQFAVVHRAASKSKLGFTEFVNPSTPPKYYLSESVGSSGGLGCGHDNNGNPFPPCNGTVSTSGQFNYDHLTGNCTGYDSRNGGSGADYILSCGPQFFLASCWGGCSINNLDRGVTTNESYTQTSYSVSQSCEGCGASGYANLGEEYTTALLIADALSLLPAWEPLGSFIGSPSEIASAELSVNEASYSVMDGKYQLAHPLPSGGIYRLTWVERFTPDGGGAPVDTPQDYTWDGSRPTGYDPNDPTTWPKSEVFEVDHPTTNGAVTLHDMQVDCGAGFATLFS